MNSTLHSNLAVVFSDCERNIRYSGVNCALGPSKSIRYSGVRLHIFNCNSAELSNVVRYKRDPRYSAEVRYSGLPL